MLGRHLIWLKEDLEAVRKNIDDDGHCKIRGIRKVHRIITKPNKPNGVKAYSNSSNTQSPALFQNIFKFCTYLPKFSNIFPFFNISLHFF